MFRYSTIVSLLEGKCQEPLGCMLKKPLRLHDERASVAKCLQGHVGCMLNKFLDCMLKKPLGCMFHKIDLALQHAFIG